MQYKGAPQHIYTSLLRGWLFLGCDRNMIMLVILIAIVIAFMTASIIGLIVALSIFTLGFVFLRRVALIDPLWRQVYIKALRYQKFYFAKSKIYFKNPVKTDFPYSSLSKRSKF